MLTFEVYSQLEDLMIQVEKYGGQNIEQATENSFIFTFKKKEYEVYFEEDSWWLQLDQGGNSKKFKLETENDIKRVLK